MSLDQLPEGFAPYRLVRLGAVVVCFGRGYDPGVLASSLDLMRHKFPECEWGILSDGGLLDDSTVVRKAQGGNPRVFPQLRILRRAA